MSGVRQITIAADDADQRLDRWFKKRFPEVSHGRLEKLLRTGQIRLDGKRAKASDRIEAGQTVRVPPIAPAQEVDAPKGGPKAKPVSERDTKMLHDAVLYKDADVLVINKPAGLAVQGGTGLDRNLDAMLDGLKFEASERPRLVHRLDKDTSGVLVLARNGKAARDLAESFRDKSAEKIYWAVVVGVPKPMRGTIDAPLSKHADHGWGERVGIDEEEGRRAVTRYAVVEHAGNRAAWLALMPETGRTHQLRAHCVILGTPILGDGKYGGAEAQLARENLPRKLHLHARSIRIPHPRKGWIAATAPLPPHMAATWKFFGFSAEPADDPFAALPRIRR
ncbi:MAG TPA: RluA family pseudouridine synthase [Candidatus Cybelea sp.]|nr:RluA family pseudouridine synthase [Candidatus Cybelea sp.]